MTLYRILFSVLFLASFICSLTLFVSGANFLISIISLIIFLLIINDIIYSSEDLDTHSKNYTLTMKFLDLILFFVLSFSIIVVSPTRNILFNISMDDLPSFIASDKKIILIWSLLLVYFFIGIIWDKLLKQREVTDRKIKIKEILSENGHFQTISIIACFLQIVIFVLFYATNISLLHDIGVVLALLQFVALVVYVTFYKIRKYSTKN